MLSQDFIFWQKHFQNPKIEDIIAESKTESEYNSLALFFGYKITKPKFRYRRKNRSAKRF